MICNFYRLTVAILIGAALITPITSATAKVSPPSYNVVNAGTPLGGTVFIVGGIEFNGEVGGYVYLPGPGVFQAVLWRNGTTIDLGTFGGPNSVLFSAYGGWGETSELSPDGTDLCENGTFLVCAPLAVEH